MATLFDELKRRHVFKVLASYAVVAWLLVQVIVAIEVPLGLPDWSDTLVIVVLAVGFPVAAVLTWIYDFTAQGIRRTPHAAPAGVAPATGIFGSWTMALAVSAAVLLLSSTTYLVVSNWDQPIETLAVLPFANVAEDPQTQYLGEGLRDTLIMRLSRIPSLRVKSRAVALAPDEDLQALGRLLGVDAICRGRLVLRGDTLEVAVELIDTRDGTIIWSNQYSREALSLLAIESEISAEIAAQLEIELSGEEASALARAPTNNPAAHRLYLQGRYFWNRRTEDGLTAAAEFYRRAIALDPNYALAYAGLADAYLMLYGWSILPAADAAPQVVAAAERAIALDPTLAEPHAALGYLKTLYEWDWDGARAEFLRAIELNNNYSSAHHWYAFYLMTIGDAAAAVEEILLAREAEPLSPIINAEVGYFYLFARRYEAALTALEMAGMLDPAYGSTVNYTMRAYYLLGRRAEALATADTYRVIVGDDLVALAYGAMALPALGLDEEARAVYARLQSLAESTYVMPGLLGVLAASIGDFDAAFAHFEDGLAERSLVLSWLRDPLLDDIRADPRFAEIFMRVGLEP